MSASTGTGRAEEELGHRWDRCDDPRGHAGPRRSQRRPRRRGAGPRVAEEFGATQTTPLPALFGGAAFDARVPATGLWEGFAGASFTLPRWVYWSLHGERGFVSTSRDETLLRRATWSRRSPPRATRSLRRAGRASSASPRRQTALRAQTEDLPARRGDALIDGALAAIGAGAVDKLVAARRAWVRSERAFDPVGAVLRATASDPRQCLRAS